MTLKLGSSISPNFRSSIMNSPGMSLCERIDQYSDVCSAIEGQEDPVQCQQLLTLFGSLDKSSKQLRDVAPEQFHDPSLSRDIPSSHASTATKFKTTK